MLKIEKLPKTAGMTKKEFMQRIAGALISELLKDPNALFYFGQEGVTYRELASQITNLKPRGLEYVATWLEGKDRLLAHLQSKKQEQEK